MGFYTKVEYHTNEGRIDLVLQTDQYIYIMEFKLNGTAEEALQQIKEKTLCSPVRSRFSKVTSDRGKLLQQNKKHREVAGGRLRLTY